MDFLKASFRGEGNAQAETDGGDPWGQWTEKNKEKLQQELIENVAGQKLPLGFNSAFHTDTVYIPFGHPCILLKDDPAKYMSYERGGTCPDDDNHAQQLMLRGCEPLPCRRRGCKLHAAVTNALPDVYINRGRVKIAHELFDEMPERDVKKFLNKQICQDLAGPAPRMGNSQGRSDLGSTGSPGMGSRLISEPFQIQIS